MPKFNVFPDDARVVDEPTGDTARVYDNGEFDLEPLAHLGDWDTREDHGATIGHVQLEVPIIFVDDGGTKVLVPEGAYLNFGHEGYYVWSDEFFQKAMKEANR